MEHKYLVGEAEREFGEESFRIVVASSPEEAADKFGQHVVIRDEAFLEHVYDRAVNMSFAEHFCLQTDAEKERFSRTGEVELSDEEFERRVREFFAGRSDFADLYLTFYSSDDAVEDDEAEDDEEYDTAEDDDASAGPESAEEGELSFPEEMLLHIWRASNWSSLTVLNIADIENL